MIIKTIPQEVSSFMAAVVYFFLPRGRTLILKKIPHHKTYPSLWGFPGGRIRGGETHEQTAIREVLEETGIQLDQQESLAFAMHSYKMCHQKEFAQPQDDKLYFTGYFFGIKISEIKAITIDPQEHSDYRIISIEKILRDRLTFPLIPDTRETLILMMKNL